MFSVNHSTAVCSGRSGSLIYNSRVKCKLFYLSEHFNKRIMIIVSGVYSVSPIITNLELINTSEEVYGSFAGTFYFLTLCPASCVVEQGLLEIENFVYKFWKF